MKDFDKTTKDRVCLVCGNDLINVSEEVTMVCAFCGKGEKTNWYCVEGHYVCSDCLNLNPKEIIKSMCLKSNKTDPIDLAKEIMSSPAIKMHGPEHHLITPAVMLTAMANYTNNCEGLASRIQKAEEMALQMAPTCNWHLGTCGAALGASIFLLIWKGLNPDDPKSWDEGNSIVASSLKRIAELGSPRCCKRDTYIAIEETVEHLHIHYRIELPISEPKCIFSLRNRSCKHEECIFFNLKYSLV
ncbi:MAG: DUF5714 domain-containing protein [Candidatus Kapaibacteriales bacterium]